MLKQSLLEEQEQKYPQIQVKAGEETQVINEWTQHNDELDELKKIFFEFLKRWTDKERLKFEPNKPIIYDNPSDAEPFELEEKPENFSNITKRGNKVIELVHCVPKNSDLSDPLDNKTQSSQKYHSNK